MSELTVRTQVLLMWFLRLFLSASLPSWFIPHFTVRTQEEASDKFSRLKTRKMSEKNRLEKDNGLEYIVFPVTVDE